MLLAGPIELSPQDQDTVELVFVLVVVGFVLAFVLAVVLLAKLVGGRSLPPPRGRRPGDEQQRPQG